MIVYFLARQPRRVTPHHLPMLSEKFVDDSTGDTVSDAKESSAWFTKFADINLAAGVLYFGVVPDLTLVFV